LVDARSALPDELSDRQWDVVEPLLAIADAAGGEWPANARRALIELCTEGRVADGSLGMQLLASIKKAFDETGLDRMPSVNLAKALGEMEDSPWAEWGKSEKPITAPTMAALLKPYEVHPHPVRDGSKVFKGYEARDFKDAWSRYVTQASVEGPQTVTRLQANADAANTDAECNRVTAVTASTDAQADRYSRDASGPGGTCLDCNGHFGTFAGWRAHIFRDRCVRAEAAD
jgi:hypothetical protein